MIKVDKGVLVEGPMGSKSTKLLWELLSVVGLRFTVVAEVNDDDIKIDYFDKYKVVEHNKHKVMLLNCASEADFNKILAVLSELCITDFYITVNSYFDRILSKVDSADMFSGDAFSIDEYLVEFPRTVHVEEDNFYFDFEMFKEYTYQLQRVANRYMK